MPSPMKLLADIVASELVWVEFLAILRDYPYLRFMILIAINPPTTRPASRVIVPGYGTHGLPKAGPEADKIRTTDAQMYEINRFIVPPFYHELV